MFQFGNHFYKNGGLYEKVVKVLMSIFWGRICFILETIFIKMNGGLYENVATVPNVHICFLGVDFVSLWTPFL